MKTKEEKLAELRKIVKFILDLSTEEEVNAALAVLRKDLTKDNS